MNDLAELSDAYLERELVRLRNMEAQAKESADEISLELSRRTYAIHKAKEAQSDDA